MCQVIDNYLSLELTDQHGGKQSKQGALCPLQSMAATRIAAASAHTSTQKSMLVRKSMLEKSTSMLAMRLQLCIRPDKEQEQGSDQVAAYTSTATAGICIHTGVIPVFIFPLRNPVLHGTTATNS
jgi:hypothetical protein